MSLRSADASNACLVYARCVKDIASLPSPGLEVRDLRVVLALAASGTTARASEALHLTQPAVSRALLSIEDRLSTRLFERSSRGLTITPAGERLVAGARRLLLELGELERSVRAPPDPPTRLRIVSQCYTAYHWLPSTLAVLRRGLPDLELELSIDHTQDPLAALASGVLDVALLTTASTARGSLEEAALFRDEVVFIMSPQHPLAARAALTRKDLQSTRLLSPQSPAAEVHWFMTKVFGRERVRLDMDRLPLTEAVLDMARAGMGVGILSEWMVSGQRDRGDLTVRRLSSGPLQRPWRLAWRKEVRGPARRLLSALQATVPHAQLSA
jgi:LysR family transcriptional regulator for metE and metH